MDANYIIPEHFSPSTEVILSLEDFIDNFEPIESTNGVPIILNFDQKSGSYYVTCHLFGDLLAENSDLEASLDSDEDDEIYKLNRDITEDKVAYKDMEADAIGGRSFEDIVIEFDISYNGDFPLKIYGGQHRIKAIEKAYSEGISVPHGVRVYFKLTKEQKVEIAIINNTSIAVSNDLLDRMREQMAGSELRDWCQLVGLLPEGKDFADKRDPDIPTVRIARTLLVNYFRGNNADDSEFHQPILCKSGGSDENYDALRETIDWQDDQLEEMGKEFARLHKLQRERVTTRDTDNYAEFARRAFSNSVVASWAYAAGLFQRNPDSLKTHYSLPDSVSEPRDPLNARALSEARLKGVDSDTYRGLGTRSSPKELGRMLEVFIVQATKASKKYITKNLANAAIQSYEAKKAVHEADKALGKI